MKKKLPLIIVTVILYAIIITLSSYYLICPNVKKLNEANEIKELTYEEKTAMIDEINQKYIVLEQEVNDKYAPSIETIENKYKTLEQEIDTKYAAKEKELKDAKGAKEVAQHQEFRQNGFSQTFYTLRDEINALQKEIWNLDDEKDKEIWNLNKEKTSELNTIEANKKSELSRLGDNKKNEINTIENQNNQRQTKKVNALFYIAIAVVIILLPLVYLMAMFNKLTKLYNLVKARWSEVDIYLKQRADLIPNIVESVKGYSDHEETTLTEITKARKQVVNASSKQEEISANEELSNVVPQLFALAEAYPDLKANDSFMSLQGNLKEIEDKISLSRKRYNQAVLGYKNKLEVFPSNVAATLFNFKPELFFEISKEEKENPKVKFKQEK